MSFALIKPRISKVYLIGDSTVADYTLDSGYFEKRYPEYVTSHYFMNLAPGLYKTYPQGQKDNTHFQPEGRRKWPGLFSQGLGKSRLISKVVYKFNIYKK